MVTSAHEVDGATAIIVVLADGRQVEGTLVGADLPTDVGVITIDAAGLPVAVLGSSEDLEAGAATVAIGTTSDGEAGGVDRRDQRARRSASTPATSRSTG